MIKHYLLLSLSALLLSAMPMFCAYEYRGVDCRGYKQQDVCGFSDDDVFVDFESVCLACSFREIKYYEFGLCKYPKQNSTQSNTTAANSSQSAGSQNRTASASEATPERVMPGVQSISVSSLKNVYTAFTAKKQRVTVVVNGSYENCQDIECIQFPACGNMADQQKEFDSNCQACHAYGVITFSYGRCHQVKAKRLNKYPDAYNVSNIVLNSSLAKTIMEQRESIVSGIKGSSDLFSSADKPPQKTLVWAEVLKNKNLDDYVDPSNPDSPYTIAYNAKLKQNSTEGNSTNTTQSNQKADQEKNSTNQNQTSNNSNIQQTVPTQDVNNPVDNATITDTPNITSSTNSSNTTKNTSQIKPPQTAVNSTPKAESNDNNAPNLNTQVKVIQDDSDWYRCRLKPIPSCVGNGISVCGINTQNPFFKTFDDYCLACADPRVMYFAAGRCVLPTNTSLPSLMSILKNSIDKKLNQTKSKATAKNTKGNSSTKSPKNNTATENTTNNNDSASNFYDFSVDLLKFKGSKKKSAQKIKADMEFFNKLKPLAYQQRFDCGVVVTDCVSQGKPVCAIFKDTYTQRTFENACKACKHPMVMAYMNLVCPRKPGQVRVTSMLIPQYPTNICSEFRQTCTQNDFPGNICGYYSDFTLIQYKNACDACQKNSYMIGFQPVPCINYPKIYRPQLQLDERKEIPQTRGTIELSEGVPAKMSLVIDGAETVPCKPYQRTYQCLRTQGDKVCGYWAKTVYKTYDSQCLACRQTNVISYSYGECPDTQYIFKSNSTYVNPQTCLYPLRGIGSCILRLDPVCSTSKDGSKRTFINSCVACNSGFQIDVPLGVYGCMATDVKFNAFLLRMLEFETDETI